MLRRLVSGVFFAASLLFLAPQSPAQSFAPSASCPCSLRGTVVDSVSGRPVNRALVRLSGQLRATLTDSEGQFQFDGLPGGSFTVLTSKPGFLGMDPGGAPPVRASLRLAPDSPPVVLKLTPESVIFGQVSGENGEPLEGFVVSLFFRNSSDGRLYPDQRYHAMTDDEGKFRIAGLRPGSYYLAARQVEGPALNSPRKSTVPMGYAPVFYPSVTDLSSAALLKLLPGKTAQTNFSLKREPFVQLSGTVSGAKPHEQVSLTLLDSLGTPQNSEVTFDPGTNSFHTKWIPPGAYTLIARATGTVSIGDSVEPSRTVGLGAQLLSGALIASSPSSFASLHVNATSSHSDLHLTLQPTVDVPVTIRNAYAADSENLQALPIVLMLISKEDHLATGNNTVAGMNPDGSGSPGDMRVFFSGVVPGTYELAVNSQSGSSFYAESANWGSSDLLRNDLVLDSSGAIPPIEVVVRDDGATLNGTVSSGDLSLVARVVLLSERQKRPRVATVDANGHFEVSGLPPGVYRVFAVDSSAGFYYTDPSFLQKISTKIQEVTLSAKQSASIDLEIVTGEE